MRHSGWPAQQLRSPISAGRGDAVFEDCPEPERLAIYLGGASSERERHEVEAHLRTCGECRTIIAWIVHSEAVVPDPVLPEKPGA